jgi:hypothetical protein
MCKTEPLEQTDESVVEVSAAPSGKADGDRLFVSHLPVVKPSPVPDRRDRTMKVTSVSPDRVEVAAPFNVQPDGSLIIAVAGAGFAPGVQIVIADQPIPTNFETATLPTRMVPNEVFAKSGDKRLVVQGLEGRSKALTWPVTSRRSFPGGRIALPNASD